jgi:hypothetical protein
MRRIQLWSVSDGQGGLPRAVGLDEVANTETESRLEELVVRSPDLLMPGLVLIGRQLPTGGGPLDLLGVEPSGRLVVFELKRGTLTRDAVAQVVHYASDVAEMGVDELARLVEKHSGRSGIEKIDDLDDWYAREYPNSANILEESPRMVLVGLGADDRARRMADFLAEIGADIQLLTFHAFTADGQLFLARQVESKTPAPKPRSSGALSKEESREHLMALAEQQSVRDLLVEVGDFISAALPAYRWPGKTAFSFSLQERTAQGAPTLRSYMTLYVDTGTTGRLILTLPERALEAAGEAADRLLESTGGVATATLSWAAAQVRIDRQAWTPEFREALGSFLEAVQAGWKKKLAEEDSEARAEDGGAGADLEE